MTSQIVTTNETNAIPTTRAYRIPASLPIAIARLREMMPAVHVPPGGWGGPAQALVAAFAPDTTAIMAGARVYGPDNERAYIVWQANMVTARCGAWQVTARRDRATWTHAGVIVTVTQHGMSAAGGSERRLARAMRVVERRAAQLAGVLGAFDWRMTCDVIATAPAEVLAVLRGDARALAVVDAAIRALWPGAQEGTEAARSAGYPTDPNDERLARFKPETRELIAFVNRGGTPAEFVRRRFGHRDASKINATNQKIRRLRSNYPALIVPARKWE